MLESAPDSSDKSGDLAQSDMYQHLPSCEPENDLNETEGSQPHVYDSATADQCTRDQADAKNTEASSSEREIQQEENNDQNMDLGHETDELKDEIKQLHIEPINVSIPFPSSPFINFCYRLTPLFIFFSFLFFCHHRNASLRVVRSLIQMVQIFRVQRSPANQTPTENPFLQ